MKYETNHKKILTLAFVSLMILSSTAAQEQRFSIEVELFANESEPKVNAAIIDSRQVTPFYGQGQYKFTTEDSEGNNLSSGQMPVSFESVGPIEGEGQSIRELDSRRLSIFMKIDNTTKTFNIYREGNQIKEVDLKKRVCEKNPCNDYCSDVINQSDLESCESYDGFNSSDRDDGDANEESPNERSTFYIVLLTAALLTLLMTYIAYRRREERE